MQIYTMNKDLAQATNASEPEVDSAFGIPSIGVYPAKVLPVHSTTLRTA